VIVTIAKKLAYSALSVNWTSEIFIKIATGEVTFILAATIRVAIVILSAFQ